MKSNLDHVVASNQIGVEQIGGKDVGSGVGPSFPGSEHEGWVKKFSDWSSPALTDTLIYPQRLSGAPAALP